MLRKLGILIALIVWMAPIIQLNASSMDDEVFCGDLPEADCQILQSNAAVMDEVHSVAFSMTMEMSSSSDEPDSDINLSVSGSGALAIDPSQADEIEAMHEDADDANMGALIESLLSAVTGETTLSMSETDGEEPFDMTFNLMLKDGVIVFSAEAVTEMTGQSMEGMEWFGIDITGGLADVLAEAGLGAAPDDESAQAPADAEAAHKGTVLRLADDEVAGIPVAVFEMRVDAGHFMPLAEAAEGDAGELIARQYIGLADHYSHRVEIDGEASLSLPGSGESVSQMNLALDIGVDLSAFNEPVAVELPEEALVFPLAMMIMMSNQAAASQ